MRGSPSFFGFYYKHMFAIERRDEDVAKVEQVEAELSLFVKRRDAQRRQAARLYAEVEDGERDVRRLIPPQVTPAASLENEPAGPTRVVSAPVTTGHATAPQRGDIERILAYLANMDQAGLGGERVA